MSFFFSINLAKNAAVAAHPWMMGALPLAWRKSGWKVTRRKEKDSRTSGQISDEEE